MTALNGSKRGLLLLLALLGACATPAPVKTDAPLVFSFNGRVAVKHHDERNNMGVHWSHHADEDDILLLAPLGKTIGHIYLDAQQIRLDYAGKQYQAEDAETLTGQILKWRLPLSGLRYWLQAQGKPGSTAQIEHNAHSQVAVLRQDGWEIRYTRYPNNRPDALPQRLVLQRNDIELTLLIDEWLTP